MSLKDEWINHCKRLSKKPADFYAGGRKILVNRHLSFSCLDDSLQMEDAGYTKSKLAHLTRNYLHEESKTVAIALWDRRRKQGSYGSVGFTCYAHFVKGGSIDAKRSKRASVFGPCLQSVMITQVARDKATVDVGYRTTEFFKKFPADLVFLRDVLLKGFNFDGMSVSVNCHFANVTIHPMYAITIMPVISDPIEWLEDLKTKDPYYAAWVVKWSARYICDEHMRGILKFSQALRVRDTSLARLKPNRLKNLQKYCRDNHPGYRNDYEPPEDGDEE